MAGDGFLKPSPYGLYETAATLNHSWGYCAWDQDWKSAETILAIRKKLNGLGINYLLNVGRPSWPDPRSHVDILREAANWQGAL